MIETQLGRRGMKPRVLDGATIGSSRRRSHYYCLFNFSSKNSIASVVPIGVKIRRSTHILDTSQHRPEVPPFAFRFEYRYGMCACPKACDRHDFRITGAFELFEYNFIHPLPVSIKAVAMIVTNRLPRYFAPHRRSWVLQRIRIDTAG